MAAWLCLAWQAFHDVQQHLQSNVWSQRDADTGHTMNRICMRRHWHITVMQSQEQQKLHDSLLTTPLPHKDTTTDFIQILFLLRQVQ